MTMSRRVFTREFKLAAMKELDAGKEVGLVARQFEVHPNVLYRWQREFKKHPGKAFSGHGNRSLAESTESALERKIGQLTMENDFLKKVLLSLEEQVGMTGGSGRSTRKSVKKAME
jgi:transposase